MRSVQTFEHRPAHHILESETVDLDNRSMAFTAFGHEDPELITIDLGEWRRTLTRRAMREGFERLLAAVDDVPPII